MGALDVKSFRELTVWREAVELVVDCYRLAELLPPGERFGIVAQMKRCATSIPANIAEGCGRDSDRELARFLLISMGSANETEYHLLLAKDLGYLSSDAYASLAADVAEVKRMMSGLLSRLPARNSKLETQSFKYL